MYTDIDKYFSRPVGWSSRDERSSQPLFNKYGQSKVVELFNKNGISLDDPDLDDQEDDPGLDDQDETTQERIPF
jgi:hypothetical protein